MATKNTIITITLKNISNNDTFTVQRYLFVQDTVNNSNAANSVGSSAGFLSGILSRITGSSSESSNVDLSTPKTRSITIPNWVTDELNTSDLAEKVSADAAELTKKATKKAKKAEKTMTAKVEKAPGSADKDAKRYCSESSI